MPKKRKPRRRVMEFKALTPRLKEYLKFVDAHIKGEGWAPTFREICEGMEVSTNAVCEALGKLEAGGYIERGRSARAIRVLKRR